VSEAIESVRPFGIDLCSAIRTAARLDRDELVRLIEIKATDAGLMGAIGSFVDRNAFGRRFKPRLSKARKIARKILCQIIRKVTVSFQIIWRLFCHDIGRMMRRTKTPWLRIDFGPTR
jgi:hypothetical protein